MSCFNLNFFQRIFCDIIYIKRKVVQSVCHNSSRLGVICMSKYEAVTIVIMVIDLILQIIALIKSFKKNN